MTRAITVLCTFIQVIAPVSFALPLEKDDCRTAMLENTFTSTSVLPLHSHRYAISPSGSWVFEFIQYEKRAGSSWSDSVQLYLFKYCYPSEHIHLATVYAGDSNGVIVSHMADGFGGVDQGGSWNERETTIYMMIRGATINAMDKKDSAEIFTINVSSIISGMANDGSIGSVPKLLKTANYPNPFRKTTVIEYPVPQDGFVAINIYNSKGELIRVLGQERQLKGTCRKIWDGKDNKGNRMAEGIYYYQVISGDFISSKAIIKIR